MSFIGLTFKMVISTWKDGALSMNFDTINFSLLAIKKLNEYIKLFFPMRYNAVFQYTKDEKFMHSWKSEFISASLKLVGFFRTVGKIWSLQFFIFFTRFFVPFGKKNENYLLDQDSNPWPVDQKSTVLTIKAC